MVCNCVNRKDTFLFIECTAVFILLLLPPLFSAAPLALPPKPEGLYAHCVFCFNTICAAAYEELLYRLYTPNRLHLIYTDYIKPRYIKQQLSENHPAEDGIVHVQLPFLPHSVLHNYFEYKNTSAVFPFFFTEFPALLLFTLAHHYLGFFSMLFAAGAGVVFRIAYLRLKRVLHPAFSIALVAAVHGIWNIGVYYYLWGHRAAA